MLKLTDIDMGYGDTQILWKVSMEVNRGEVVALIGPNGAGKTTLMYTMTGLYAPWNGSINWDGKDITKSRADERVHFGMALVPQGRRLFPSMTVEQNLMMGALHRKDAKSEIDKDFTYVYDLFPRLKERRTQLAGRMSGGEQQMCAVGRALMARPQLLLIDEMSLGLAPVAVDGLVSALAQVVKDGLTLLLVEQDVEIALEMADRGYVLENGSIALEGESHWLHDHAAVKEAYLGI